LNKMTKSVYFAREGKKVILKRLPITESEKLCVIRYFMHEVVYQYLEEPEGMKRSFDQEAKGLNISGFNLYVRTYAVNQLKEIDLNEAERMVKTVEIMFPF